ncbi:MAG: DHA2 family efflux MFS transporter permease subunit [Phycisphaerales bacterium]|nr:DHA2 family efflux MFS transporter permease subunit [Phycisphaerales bacterium]
MSVAAANLSYEASYAPHNPWLIAVVATLATFMEVLDTSIANVALPHIAGNLGASISDSTWVLTSYLVANAIILPASAWLVSVIGRRNYYLLSVALFTGSSLLCGLAPSLGALVVFRLLQGLGGGGLQPLTQSILVDTFPPSRRGMGMAVYGMTVVVAPVIGPTLGGWITDNYNWRWIFFINVPVGIGALILSHTFISDPPYLRRRRGAGRWRADFVGLGLVAVGLGALQLVLDLGERHDWFNSPLISTCAAASGLALLLGVLWELNHREPILNLRVLRDRNLGLACVHMLIFGAVLFGSTALLPLFMQTVLGYTAEQSGLALSPGGVAIAVLMPFVGILVTRLDVRWMIVLGILIVSYALWMMGGFTLQTDFRTIVVTRVVQGLGLGLIFVPLNTVAYATVPATERNNASSLISIARNIGGSVGIGYAAAMLSRGAQTHQALMVHTLTPESPAYSSIVAALTERFTALLGDATRAAGMAKSVVAEVLGTQARALSYLDQFKFLAAAFLVLIPVVLLMRRLDRGRRVEVVVE